MTTAYKFLYRRLFSRLCRHLGLESLGHMLTPCRFTFPSALCEGFKFPPQQQLLVSGSVVTAVPNGYEVVLIVV